MKWFSASLRKKKLIVHLTCFQFYVSAEVESVKIFKINHFPSKQETIFQFCLNTNSSQAMFFSISDSLLISRSGYMAVMVHCCLVTAEESLTLMSQQCWCNEAGLSLHSLNLLSDLLQLLPVNSLFINCVAAPEDSIIPYQKKKSRFNTVRLYSVG